MDKFLKNVYGILFEPSQTIDELIESAPVRQALIIVVLLSSSSAFLNYKIILPDVFSTVFLISNIIGAVLSSLIFWFVLAGFFEVVSAIFNDESHYKQLLSLMGFSLLPWIFTSPLELLGTLPIMGVFCGLGKIAVWAWSISLIFLSVKKLYGLTNKKTWLFFLLPILGSIIVVNWISYFFNILMSLF